MTIKLGVNIASLRGIRQLDKTSNSLATAFERLSTGQRINRAADDAAGLAISDALNSDQRVFSQAIRNLNDGISAINIADGALESLSNIVIRQIELAEQSANGVFSNKQRYALNEEFNALVSEYNRIIESTEFNDRNLLQNPGTSFSIFAGYGDEAITTVDFGSKLARTVGDGTFQSAINTIGGTIYAFNSGDFNGDGLLDLVHSFGPNEFRVMAGDGQGGFSLLSTVASPGLDPYKIDVGDFNGDGRDDFAANNNGTIVSYFNNGNGQFTSETLDSFSQLSYAQFSSDFNNDGYDDLLTYNNTLNEIVLYTGSEDGFNEAHSAGTYTGSDPTGTTVIDYDKDGYLDVIAAQGNKVSLYINDRKGNFNSGIDLITSGYSGEISVGDLNQDGILDLVAQEGEANTYIYHGTGNNQFTLNQTLTNSAYDGELSDLNGDGILDLIVVGDSGSTFTYLNDKAGNFILTDQIDEALKNIVTGDFNSDGATDIIVDQFGLQLANTTQVTTAAHDTILTQKDARRVLDGLKDNLNRIISERGNIGTIATRLETQMSVFATRKEEYVAASSRILDADIANEAVELVRGQILQQVGARVLGQSNLQPNLVLSLLA